MLTASVIAILAATLFPIAGAESERFIGLAWVAALWVPAGFWARTRRDGWLTGVALVDALLGAPVVTPLRATPFLQWAAAGLGALAGAVARLAIERRAMPAPPGPLAG